MTEQQYQAKLIKQYESEGYYVVKITVCNKPGFPDLMLMRDGSVRFVEVKAKTGRVDPLQLYRHKEIRAIGFDVEVKKSDK